MTSIRALCDQALASYQAGRLAEAEQFCIQMREAEPDNYIGYYLQGLIQFGRSEHREAKASMEAAVAAAPAAPEPWVYLGLLQERDFKNELALASYDQALSIAPRMVEAMVNRGNLFVRTGRPDKGIPDFDLALQLKPDFLPALMGCAVALGGLGRHEEALAMFEQLLAREPNNVQAQFNRGMALLELGRPEFALAAFDNALVINPRFAQAWNGRTLILLQMKRLDEALASAEQALSLQPAYVDALQNRAAVLKEMQRPDEALASVEKILVLMPNSAEAWNSHGSLLNDLERPGEALVSLDRAISLDPHKFQPWVNRGFSLSGLKRLDESAASYGRAFAINPNLDFLQGHYFNTRMKTCNWDDFEERLAECIAGVSEGRKVIPPWAVLSLVDDPSLHQIAARIYSATKYPPSAKRPSPRTPDGKIRIGYYSADFHLHPVSLLVAEMLEAHDRERFELYGFSFGPDNQDEVRKRVSAAFHKFIDVRAMADKDVARLSRELGIDLAVDLKGHTLDARPGIFAEGCAPVQAQYIGYPGTMGADYIDYIIADRTVLPPESLGDYDEKAVWLPGSFLANDSTRKISERKFTKQEMGLPEQGFVFCCFNNSYKILPASFGSWMRILKAVDGSVLWLPVDSSAAAENLRKEAKARGVDPGRLIFARRLDSMSEHLARQRLADLFLDTWPYNAHTTASDALWAGLPVLTYMGKSFASRVAGSLLTAVGLPELITHSAKDYEAMAIDLALHPEKLARLRGRLAQNRITSPLFDGKLIARHMEAAFRAMLARAACGLPPDNIEIAP